jgi:hypothetical protein
MKNNVAARFFVSILDRLFKLIEVALELIFKTIDYFYDAMAIVFYFVISICAVALAYLALKKTGIANSEIILGISLGLLGWMLDNWKDILIVIFVAMFAGSYIQMKKRLNKLESKDGE